MICSQSRFHFGTKLIVVFILPTLTKIQTFATALPNSTSLINFSFNTRDDLFDSAKVRMYNSPKVIFRLLLQLAMFDSEKVLVKQAVYHRIILSKSYCISLRQNASPSALFKDNLALAILFFFSFTRGGFV